MADGSKACALLGTAAGPEHHTEAPQVAGRGGSHGDATGRCESKGRPKGLDSTRGGPGLLEAQANDTRDLAWHGMPPRPLANMTCRLPSLRIVASDNKVPIGRVALPLEGRVVG